MAEEQHGPDPKELAAQLRKPSGEFGTIVGNNMNEVNNTLYDLVLDCMQLKKGYAILEIGFGNGKLFDKLFAIDNGLHISGLDYSADMVNEAIENNRHHISSGNMELKQGNSDAIPFPDNSFDKIFCCNVIYFWDMPSAHLKEVHRVLKPGGIFYAGFRSRSSMQGFPFTQYGFTLYEEPEWVQVITENGFSHSFSKESRENLDMEEGSFVLSAFCVAAKK